MSSDLPRLLAALPVALPPGKLVHGEEGDDEQPAMWVSDGPASAELWTSLRAAQGLWPLLLDDLNGDPAPWDLGELWPADMGTPDAFDAETLMAGWWADHTAIDEDDMLTEAERLAVTAPYGQRWPGLAEALPAGDDPDQHAVECVTFMLADNPRLRLGLAPTGRGADSITALGWQGPVNFENDTAKLSAVLRSWESRFGVRVIGIGYAELYLSVAAPPTDTDTALRVAAEHFAFCPDNVWQGNPTELAGYAKQLLDAPVWSFWWD